MYNFAHWNRRVLINCLWFCGHPMNEHEVLFQLCRFTKFVEKHLPLGSSQQVVQ